MCELSDRRRVPDVGRSPARNDGESNVGIRSKRIRTAAALAVAAAVVVGGGVAVAAAPDSSGAIIGCFDKSGGNLRVIDAADRCKPNETRIEWNEEGPAG